ncbi:MAG: pilus assembly PilX N-terminal domain-containing protein [Candidatus Eremiobacteraeota bacterium]|nr:pilus assembly PilX N-terminal domain-containing protein [Candidatus Eremiobacteraeota bacterium]
MRKDKGIALITVLLISVIMLILILSVMGITSNNAIFMSNFRDRTSALYAAEAGIHRAIDRLTTDPYFSGTITETLPEGKGKFTATVDNAGLSATIVSTGTVRNFKRTLQVVVETDANAFSALVCDGQIIFSGDYAYINGIKSIKYPKVELGNIHTNSPSSNAITGDPAITSVTITGKASAVGGVGNVIPDGHRYSNAPEIPTITLDKSSLLNTTFTQFSIPPDGQINQNTRIDGNLEIDGHIRLNNNCILYVVGDLKINGSLTGHGAVVVEGKTSLHGITQLDLNNTKGVVVYGEGDVSVAHPLYEEGAKGYTEPTDIKVAKFFARMPSNAPQCINSNLPPDAPRGPEFFEWYYQKSHSEDKKSDFFRWRNGNQLLGQDGIPEDVKNWLDSGASISEYIKSWYSENENQSLEDRVYKEDF